ncbi:hypothetical protein V8B97DRAFT_1863572 [Scleroderma yunnanense]
MSLTVRFISSSSGRVAHHPTTRRHYFRPCFIPHNVHYSAASHQEGGQSSSAKLFQDAAQEEAAEAPASSGSRLSQAQDRHENRTGEESVQDAVLRMLIDKYKPLRTGIIRTADEKLKDAPPQVSSGMTHQPGSTRTWKEIANEPLLPAVEGHKPWHTTFKAPSHTSTSIKLGNIRPSTGNGSVAIDDRTTRGTEREPIKRKEQASRLTRARESTLDYWLGVRCGSDVRSAQVNPISLKGWQSLVEDRIEVRGSSGIFDKVKGRGQPIIRLSEERNPFIAREEFLMNRIVQRNGAAPPWIEVQIELESAVNAFRQTLRQSWTRRVVRMLTVSKPAAMLPTLSLATVMAMRDREWEDRERSYHDTAIAELNSLVRKYNAMAPYAVRRPYYTREVELDKTYEECGEEILRAVEEKCNELPIHPVHHSTFLGDDAPLDPGFLFGLRALILQWIERLRRRFTGGGQP